MTLNGLLSELSQRKVKLYLDGEQLGIRAPKGALNQELKQSLKEYKEDILRFLQQQAVVQKKTPPIETIDREQILPLSLAQERLWLLENLGSNSAVYNLSVAFSLKGPLKLKILEKSIAEVIKRHEVLRTHFKKIDHQPIVVINNNFNFQLNIRDIRSIPLEKREAEIQLIITKQVQKPFNLVGDLLWRMQLIHVQEQEYIFLLTMHHLISDGWSFGIFLKEINEIYQAWCLENQPSLSPLSIQYVDFAQWQRDYLNSGLIQASRNYWQQKLTEELTPLKLPIDQEISSVVSYRGKYKSFNLSKDLIEQLKELSKREGVSLFNTLLTTFGLLLNRHTQQEELLICSPVLGRNPSETENLIGYFNNILPLHISLSGNPTFRELLQRVRQVTTDAYEHQEIPFQELAELPGVRNIPLTRGMFNLDKGASDIFELPGIEVQNLEVDNGEANFDLSVNLFEQSDSHIKGVFNYKIDLFSETIITQMIERFQFLLETLVNAADTPVNSLKTWIIEKSPESKITEKPVFIAPRNHWETGLVAIWEELLGVKPIGIADNFFALGGHSILALRLFSKIEEKYGKNLGLSTLLQAPTIEQMAEIISSDQPTISWSSLVPIQPNGSNPPLFCFHAVGGNVLTYLELSQCLSSEQPVYGLQARGLDGKDDFDTCIEDMATHYLEEILTLDFPGPYFLGGLSGGGVIAFEVAQQLQARGKEVALVILFDSYNPQYIRERTTADQKYRKQQKKQGKSIVIPQKRLKFFQRITYKISRLFGIISKLFSQEGVANIPNKIRSQQEYWKNLRELWMYQLNPKAGKPLPQLLRTELITKNLKNAVKTYIPEKYSGKIALFRVDSSIYQSEEGGDTDELGWEQFAEEGLEIYRVSGDHNTLLTYPHVEIVAEKLKELLD
ncbi:MAG TPA: hypothetical protein DCF68_14205 [Cyanothece sp. UBA12306]|nr:hypothetical protein [Cyanothece sp. UBA12306]